MKKRLGIAACCLVVVAGSLLVSCNSASSIGNDESKVEVESSQGVEVSAKGTATSSYKDGTYQGEGRGMGGPIIVTLTITDGVLAVEEIAESAETPGIGGKEAIEDGTFKAQIEEAQSADIDGVSGATMTTGGVKTAVAEALEQAQ